MASVREKQARAARGEPAGAGAAKPHITAQKEQAAKEQGAKIEQDAPAVAMLPESKTKPTLGDPVTAKVLVFGQPKIGKSTLVAGIAPDETLFLATEPGLGGLEVFQLQVKDWHHFIAIIERLRKGDHKFKMVAIDTVDNLAKMCQDAVVKRMKIEHPSDLEWGKGWDAVGSEFQLRIAAIAGMGMGVWFISHEREVEIKRRGVTDLTVYQPAIGGSPRKFIEGFVDYHLYATFDLNPEGEEERVLRTQPGLNWYAGARGVPLDDPILLMAPVLKDAIVKAGEEFKAAA